MEFERSHFILGSVYNDEEVLKSTTSPKADDSTGSEVTSVSKEASSPNCTKATEVQPEFTKIKERKVLKPCEYLIILFLLLAITVIEICTLVLCIFSRYQFSWMED